MIPRSMAASRGPPTLQLLFGKAFLVALAEGQREKVMAFARAFLSQSPHERADLVECSA